MKSPSADQTGKVVNLRKEGKVVKVRNIWNLGIVEKVGRVGNVGKIGKVGKVIKVGPNSSKYVQTVQIGPTKSK